MQADTPIQFFGVISTVGEFTPLKFKYADSDGCVHTVYISEIISADTMQIAGRRILRYRCWSRWEDMRIPVELRYDIISHKWIFKRRLDQGF